jgi:hypothetical protein
MFLITGNIVKRPVLLCGKIFEKMTVLCTCLKQKGVIKLEILQGGKKVVVMMHIMALKRRAVKRQTDQNAKLYLVSALLKVK